MLSNTAERVQCYMGDSLAETVRWIAETPRRWSYKHSETNRPERKWDLNVGYDGALRLAREGWADGVKELFGQLTAHFPQQFEKEPPWRFDVAGQLPDVPRFLRGQPDHMLTRGRAKGAKPIVHIVINTVCSAYTNDRQFVNYGAAICAMIDQIEAGGKRVELDVAAVFGSLNGGNTAVLGWKVKRAGDPVDLADIAFALAHPAAFRRIQFGMVERTPGSWQTADYGYCASLTPKLAKLFDADNAFLLDGVGEAGSRCNTPEEALAMAQEQLRRAEEKVHAQQAS